MREEVNGFQRFNRACGRSAAQTSREVAQECADPLFRGATGENAKAAGAHLHPESAVDEAAQRS